MKNNPVNTQLKDQLLTAMKSGKLKVKHFDGYKKWKNKFDYWHSVTKDVQQTFNTIYGPGGSVTEYKGSVLANANFVTPKKPKSKAFQYMQYKKK